MTGKIFRSIMAAACVVLLASLLIVMGCLYEYFGNVQENQLKEELDLAVAGVENSGREYLAGLNGSNNRLTWIAADGSVLYDAQADEQTMENHAEREEVQQAFATGEGASSRYSKTLLEKTLYCAKLLSDGSVLRISVSHASMAVLALGMLQPVCIIMAAVLALAFFLAHRLAGRIVEPLNKLDLDNPLANNTYDELAPLLRRISQQSHQIDSQLKILQQKKDEFAQVTASMNEGLVLLDNNATILSINPAATALFHTGPQAVGQQFLTVERSREVNEAMTRALDTGHSEICLLRDGREYQIDMSRIESEGAAAGAVLLAFDVTEKRNAERTRREFTANVSHELKTPLTIILGSAEIIQAGMVKPDDMQRFVGHIHDEAARLLALIEDIIRLSQLDEGVALPSEAIDLGAVAEDVAEQLAEKAGQHNVKLEVQADTCLLQGVPRLIHEIAYNLTENAIKYNVAGGTVKVCVANTEAGAVLSVADTGIGIPPEHQSRVFERFYRVDKSHSKASGGTGLGLSIVKHACAYLGAAIKLQSEQGKGTTITVVLPKQQKEA